MSHHIPSVSWQQARQILHKQGLDIAHHVKTESLPLLATIGHYLADDVYSMMPVPHYSSSAMDGSVASGDPGVSGGFSREYSPSDGADCSG